MTLDIFVGCISIVTVILSFISKNTLYLRVLYTIGITIITIYAIIIEAYLIAVLDGFIVLINVYQLHRLHKNNLLT
ncbi:hypothetical protein C5468_24970 [Photorhabdus luminescens subsp. mexicana]|uniref:Inner membrane protein n=1 Tax=Photorhabdus luminescens subsp. mexicana TaxID=2100167 RepID=A0A4V2X418_PHOLU|nr:hypothetical protein C5468_24970 [Photorhabdus luminescens subsp. mexicana]